MSHHNDHAHGQQEPHPHEHDHDHKHDHDHNHDHDHSGPWGWLARLFHLHGHSHGSLISDRAFADNETGIRTVWLALAILLFTSVLQLVIFFWSGSVALLADTIHNIGDGLNSLPLLLAFYLARRAANRRYTYGYARAEDVAGIFIVLSILVSAGIVFWESFQKLIDLEPMRDLGWVAAAAVIGFLGNEAVASLQIRVGQKIGSAALVADGQHARTDGLTSLAVLLAAGGTWLGFPILDPIIGLIIGLAILFIARDATMTIWYRLMDAIEPDILSKAEAAITAQPEIKALERLRMRWVGHRLHAEIYIAVDPNLTVAEGHDVGEQLRHALFHEIGNLAEVMVHVDPWSEDRDAYHQATLHHEAVPQQLTE